MTALLDQLQSALGAAFTLERELGGGGMSRVFLAQDTALGRPVVIKVLAPELAEGLSAERFAREIRLSAALQHPNIVPVLVAGGDPDGLPYYTMPFIEGASLRERLTRGRVPLEEAIVLLRDVARALAYAHAHGVVHRDIKPDNVLLTGGAAVVADFGIAKAVTAAGGTTTMTQTGMAIGTPAYMAPEQVLGDSVDERADLYAWGLVAWETFAGTHPFSDRGSAQQLVAAQMSQTPRDLAEECPGLPAPLAALVMRCLAKEPGLRPRSASELVSLLDDAMRTAGGRPAQSGPMSKRGRILLFAGAIAATLIGIVTIVAWNRRPQQNGGQAPPPRIAVLPFENLGSANEDVFAAGITDEITSRLAGIRSLRVVSRTSARRFRQRDAHIAEVGRALNADYILEGTVRTERRAAGSEAVRVTPQLIRVADDVQVWQKTLDATVTPGDVFRIQTEIATDVAAAMDVALLSHERTRVARVATRDSAAYRFYQLGRFHWEKRSPQSLVLAQQYFRAAIARDSGFAGAWAGLGDAIFISNLLVASYADSRSRTDEAIAALRRAVALDSALAEGWAGLGYALTLGRFDAPAADSAFRRALTLDPGYAPTHYWYSQLLRMKDSLVASEAAALEAVNLDPLSAVAHIVLGNAYTALDKRDAGLTEFERAVELQPGYPQAHMYLAIEYARRRQLPRAKASARQFIPMYVPAPVAGPLADEWVSALAGEGDPVAVAARLTTHLRVGHHEAVATIFAVRGMLDSAFARAHAAIDQRSGLILPMLAYLRPIMSPDRRWPVLMTRLRQSPRD